MRKAIVIRLVCCFVLYLTHSTLAFAQATPPQTLTLDAAIDLAEGNYPANRVAKAQAQAASAEIGLARTAYLPRLDLLWQENRATTNNIFDGIISERNVDKGSLVGPSTGPTTTPLLRVQQISRLRLIIPVPETDVSGIAPGTRVNFTVPAFPGENFAGVVQRISHTLDEKTRTMPVELDVINDSGRLAPGMFPEVLWPTRRPKPSLFVPASAIATTTERRFVIRIRNGVTEWVDIKRGITMGDLVEVFGDLGENDLIAVRGTDELRPDTRVATKQVPQTQQTKW